MLFSIDRVVGQTAVLIDERGKPMDVPLRMLPPGAKAGEMVEYEDGGFRYAPEKTALRRETIAGVLGQLLARGDETEDSFRNEAREPGGENAGKKRRTP